MEFMEMPWRKDAVQRAAASEAEAQSAVAGLVAKLYRFRRARNLVRRICLRLEGGRFYSKTWRALLRDHHGVEIGHYSYGDILEPGVLPAGTIVGNYCSVGARLIVRRRNHPMERPFLHPFFYESDLGLLERGTIAPTEDNPLTIGHDVWIADRVTILPGCRNIGNGAVLAAGAIVTRDVPAYTVVAGNPARPLRMRFGPERIAEIEASRWWTRDIADLIRNPPVGGIPGDLSDKISAVSP